MISLICFKEDLIILKQEAEELGLKHNINARIGWQDNKLCLMQSYDCYKEDCTEKDGKYYKNQEDLKAEKNQDNYYLYTKYLGKPAYVHVERDNHLVDLIPFANKCKYWFFIKESIKSETPTINNIQVLLQTIEEKTEKINILIDKVKENTFNSKTKDKYFTR